ncbi:MAG: amidohydrolase family protein [Cyclobacteriaceae bacterium]|uniref:amidohydrolase family protein n=1 Tax=Fulvivirga sp. TaxID=1931237 RepID=UPI0032EDE774
MKTAFRKHLTELQKHWILCLVILLVFSCQQNRQDNQVYTAIKNVTIIDGTGGTVQENMVILLKDSIIQDIQPIDDYDFPPNTEIIDAAGKYVIPGLIDVHAHVTVLRFDQNLGISDKIDWEASLQSLKTMLQYGITTVRNVAAPTNEGILIRDSVAKANLPSPTIYTSGAALNKSTHTAFISTKTEEEVRIEVRNQVEKGVDLIKVYAGLEPPLVKAAIDEAHKQGVPVIGHLQNTTWTEAAEMGIDFITHAGNWNGYYLDDVDQKKYAPTMKGRLDWIEWIDLHGSKVREMLDVMYKNGVSVDPTLIVFHTKFWAEDSVYRHNEKLAEVHPTILDLWNAFSFVSDWTDEDFKRGQSLWPKLASLTKAMYDRGIMLTAGSDFPNPWVMPGLALHQEMALMVQAGIPVNEVIKIATLNGAKALRIDRTHGSLEVGKVADILILNKNPLEDIFNTKSIAGVMVQGKLFE